MQVPFFFAKIITHSENINAPQKSVPGTIKGVPRPRLCAHPTVNCTVGGAQFTVGGAEFTVGGAVFTVGGAVFTVGGVKFTVGGATQNCYGPPWVQNMKKITRV